MLVNQLLVIKSDDECFSTAMAFSAEIDAFHKIFSAHGIHFENNSREKKCCL